MPVYKTVSAGLTVKEILDICVGQKVPEEKICQKVPSMIDWSAVFVVDLSVVNFKNLPTDDAGIYGHHSSPSEVVDVYLDYDRNVVGFEKVSKGDEAIKQECESRFTVWRQYSWHSSNKGYRRIISKVEHEDKFLHLAVVQYIVTTSNTSSLFSTPYGNAKRREPHQRMKPSVLTKIRDMGASQSAKHIISQLEREAEDVATISSASYLPRDRQQVYNQLKKVEGRTKSRSTGPSKARKHHEAVDVTAFRFISEKRQFVIQAMASEMVQNSRTIN